MIDDEKDELTFTHVERGLDGRSKRQVVEAEISERIVREALAIEQQSAKDSGNLAKLAKYSAASGSLGPFPTSIHLTKKPGWQIVVVDSISFHRNAIQGEHGLGKTVGNSFQD